jgi:multidrug efflux pump subunit AcrB
LKNITIELPEDATLKQVQEAVKELEKSLKKKRLAAILLIILEHAKKVRLMV